MKTPKAFRDYQRELNKAKKLSKDVQQAQFELDKALITLSCSIGKVEAFNDATVHNN
jgi:hypothetical protein